MRIYIGSDHAGYKLKEELKKYLGSLDYKNIEDKGAFILDSDDDYPDFILPVAESVAKEKDSFGIILGGSGQGEQMAANKVRGIRATEYYGGDTDIVKVSREHNNANILSIGARFATEDEAMEAVKVFLQTKFSGELRHLRRIAKF
jgi:ribose 5-phosphate isomerase B